MSRSAVIWLIIAAFLVLTGCIIFGGVMIAFEWDFTKLSTTKYETNSYEIDEDFKNISIVTDTADIVFEVSDSNESKVVCYEPSNTKHSVSVKDGTLIIELTDTRKWYEHIGVNFTSPRITVYIPKGECEAVSVKSSTGNISIGRISAKTLDFSVSTGRITVSDVDCTGDVKIGVSTGKTTLNDVKCRNLTSSGNTGDIYLKNVIVAEKLTITRTTGDVKLDACDAADILIKSNTGDVKCSLLSDKHYTAQTGTGNVDVPKVTSGGGLCDITTSTGDIKVTVLQ